MIFTQKHQAAIRVIFAEENAALLESLQQEIKSLAQETRQMFQQELAAAFQRDLVMELKPRKPGDPEKVVKERRVNIIDEITKYLPHVEGALRGMQTDVGRQRDYIGGLRQAVLAFEKPLVAIARDRCLDVPAQHCQPGPTMLPENPAEQKTAAEGEK